ncbi:class I SAM-dependent rRNA methyltransferase [Roseomonas nepalensis]|uniref:Class I SAM-dependent rRNA methyltransferase n=1 Tax=Muricoccus nepalensis TaxID=1854500 RepID=A0A502GCG4_9PROT|nr:class I SAM-dependent rRNA methyltransferase [Roseomonas nepalensis]TPG59544.1 class I SAM-dependent rRNA methyltransferase [Roseomonas nepalensis]
MPDLPLIRLLPGRDRRAKAGHPWVFSNEVAMTPAARAIPPGSAVRVEADDGARLGVHHFNPHSLIAARRLARDPDAAIDDAFWGARLAEALSLRERLFATPHYRLVHAEADGMPGLVLDRYGDLVALQANTAGMEAATPSILRALDALIAPRAVVARNEAGVRALEGLPEATLLLRGTEATGTVEEGGVRFSVDPLGGQKTGWFFDQRENRARVANLARGETVLDAFCHTGGFGLQAAAAGAARVTLLDRSEHALATAMETARRNGLDDRVEALRGEAMEGLERLGREGTRYGVVVVDPPAFAKSRKDIPAAVRAYGRLARLAAALVAPGGFLFIASCSHHVPSGEFADTVLAGLQRARRDARILALTGAGPDHPLHPMLPESAYLKALTLQLS